MVQVPHILARITLSGLFAFEIFKKLSHPNNLLDPLRNGLGLHNLAASTVFVGVNLALALCISVLLFRPGPLGYFLSALFLLGGAIFAVMLSQLGWTGSCGCGVGSVVDFTNPLHFNAYQNTACAVLCATLGFRALSRKGTNDEE